MLQRGCCAIVHYMHDKSNMVLDQLMSPTLRDVPDPMVVIYIDFTTASSLISC